MLSFSNRVNDFNNFSGTASVLNLHFLASPQKYLMFQMLSLKTLPPTKERGGRWKMVHTSSTKGNRRGDKELKG